MRKLDLKLSGGRAEAAIAILSFGGSSLYWLALAFAMSPAAYGKMMTMQAAVLIVVTIFTFRTHDLFFNLIAQHNLPADVAYRRTLRIELMAGTVGAVLCTLTALVIEPTGGGLADAAGFAVFALLASLAVIQGASIGKLRYLTRGDIISRTDLLSAAAWLAACAMIPLIYKQSAIVPLIVGSAPPAMRTLALFISVRRFLPRQDARPAGEAPAIEVGNREIIRFLAGAQVTNVLKNAGVSIETLILAAFAPSPVVAMFRLARATHGASNAALNVANQRSYPILVRAGDAAARFAAARGMQTRSLMICLVIYPLSALASLGYSLLKPQVGILELQLMTAGTFLALLPAGLQQGSMALLMIDGDHRSVGTAYVISLLVLGLTALIMLVHPSVVIFIEGLICAGFIRAWYLDRKSRETAHRTAPPAMNAPSL